MNVWRQDCEDGDGQSHHTSETYGEAVDPGVSRDEEPSRSGNFQAEVRNLSGINIHSQREGEQLKDDYLLHRASGGDMDGPLPGTLSETDLTICKSTTVGTPEPERQSRGNSSTESRTEENGPSLTK
ncbi:hypothetical protein GBF38_007815 [Nibea albiflora]|uniref:Uncharacterized protein n=1 Tax=Nibea albiflora TaxID=240163 RepID=A0ACB7EPW1_NIBAL|nr:hypothetical protein GBF38_007815 [Nibea albiflora]